MRATRQIKQAQAEQLTAMSDGLALIMDNQRYLSPHVLPILCDLQEEITAETGRRSKEDGTAGPWDLIRRHQVSPADDQTPRPGRPPGVAGPPAQAM